MKSFLSIFLGSIVGGIIYVCATFNFFPQDSGEYFSFGNTILIIGLFSSVAAIVFYVMGRVLKIKADNPLHLGTAALVTQLAIWGIVHMPPVDGGTLGLAFATLVFSFVANVFLDRLSYG
jgi:hypothetical protein